jgi:hypothetical protein
LPATQDGGDKLFHDKVCSEAWTPCGGDPTGTWDVVGVCTTADLLTTLNEPWTAVCGQPVTAADMAAGGSVTYDAGTVTYSAVAHITTSVDYPSACVSDMCNCDGTAAASCQTMQEMNQNNDPDKHVVCTFTGTSCDCHLRTTKVLTQSVAYSVNGTLLYEEGQDGSSEFCVEGDRMRVADWIWGDVYVLTEYRKR